MTDRDNLPTALTPAEIEVLNALGQAWNLFCVLPEQHDADAREFCLAIHAAQNIVLARLGMRSLGDIRGGSKHDRG